MGATQLKLEPERTTVLYVDDDLAAQSLLSAALGKQFNVVSETSGTGALSKAEQTRPSLILLDLSMPHVDGFEVLSLLRHHPMLASVPVICLSGQQDQTSRDRAYKLGCAGFITKPIKPKQIAIDIQNLLASLNIEMESRDKRKSLFIGYSSNVTDQKFRQELVQCLSQQNPCLVLSLHEGQSFHRPEYETALESGLYLYLQIKPSLLTRFPFLEDFSPIREDLKSFLHEAPSDMPRKLFFHHFDLMLNWKDLERTTAAAIAFNEMISHEFQHIRYFWNASRDFETVDAMNRMARTLMGHF